MGTLVDFFVKNSLQTATICAIYKYMTIMSTRERRTKMKVITDEIITNALAKQMNRVSRTHYLLFMYMLDTGIKLRDALSVVVEDAENTLLIPALDFIYGEYAVEIFELIKAKEKNKRLFEFGTDSIEGDAIEFEKTLKSCAKDCLYNNEINSDIVCYTFYYNFLRNNNYFFLPLRQLFFSRAITIPSLESFLNEIDMTYEEYLEEKNNYLLSDINEYKAMCDAIINCFSDINELIDSNLDIQDDIDVKVGTLHKVEAVYNIMNKLEFFN